MAYMTVNGVDVVTDEGVSESPEDVGQVSERGLIGNLIITRTGRLRTWRFTTPQQAASIAEPLRKWLEGDGQHWSFRNDKGTSATVFSTLGVGNSIAGTFTVAATGGFAGLGRISVSSASQFAVRLQSRLGIQRPAGWDPVRDGWTLICHRKMLSTEGAFANTFQQVVMKGKVAFVRAASSGNPAGVKQYLDGVLGSYALGNSIQVSLATPFFALFGFRVDNVGASIDFSNVSFLPFEIPDAWVAPISAWSGSTRELSSLPRVKVFGDFVDDVDPFDVICRARTIEQRVAMRGGVFKANERRLQVDMNENL